jgi:hypothetical protein
MVKSEGFRLTGLSVFRPAIKTILFEVVDLFALPVVGELLFRQ